MEVTATTVQPTLGPRAQAFADECINTKNQIIDQLAKKLLGNKNLSPQNFHKEVTVIHQEELAQLDEKTKRLFKAILFDVYQAIITTKPLILQGLLAFNQLVSPTAQGEIMKSIALTPIKAMIAELNQTYPGVIDEATENDLTPEQEKLFTALNVKF